MLDTRSIEMRLNVTLVLGKDFGLGFFAAEFVAQWCFDDDFVEDGAVVEGYGECVGDCALGGVVVVLCELGIFDALDAFAEVFEEFGGGGFGAVGVVLSGQAVEDQHGCDHVLGYVSRYSILHVKGTDLNTVVTVGKVVHGLELLVNNADASLVGAVGNLLDVFGGLAKLSELLVDDLRTFNGSLRVEFSCKSLVFAQYSGRAGRTRIGNLEENVLHDIAAIRTLELKLLALEKVVVETPDRSAQNSRNTTLTLENLEHKVHSTLASITSSPGLPGHGVWRMTVCTQTLTINPRLGDSIGSLLLIQTQQLGRNSGSRNLDKHNMVQTNLVERVLQREHTLNLMRLDHSLQDITNLQDLALSNVSTSPVCARNPVGNGKDTAQVVGRMTPFGRKPAVIVIEPSDHGTDVESSIDRIELIRSSGNFGTVGDHGAVHDRTEQFGALVEAEGL